MNFDHYLGTVGGIGGMLVRLLPVHVQNEVCRSLEGLEIKDRSGNQVGQLRTATIAGGTISVDLYVSSGKKPAAKK